MHQMRTGDMSGLERRNVLRRGFDSATAGNSAVMSAADKINSTLVGFGTEKQYEYATA